MKTTLRFISALLLAATLAGTTLSAQRSRDEYLTRYSLLTGRFGPAGVGVETLVANWEKDYPEDPDMLCAKFSYYFTKSRSASVVTKEQDRFMGSKPLFSLPDTTRGVTVHYFEEYFYDDSLFAISSAAIQKAIRLFPEQIDLRFNAITATLAYEKESPDMARAALISLIDYHYTSFPEWTFKGEPVDEDFFCSAIQEYCFSFFQIASASSMDAFKALSDKMLSYKPQETRFIDNLGSWELAWNKNPKKASKYFKRALRINPKDYTAVKNSVLIARNSRDNGNEAKYLTILAEITDDEVEKASALARLEKLKKGK